MFSKPYLDKKTPTQSVAAATLEMYDFDFSFILYFF